MLLAGESPKSKLTRLNIHFSLACLPNHNQLQFLSLFTVALTAAKHHIGQDLSCHQCTKGAHSHFPLLTSAHLQHLSRHIWLVPALKCNSRSQQNWIGLHSIHLQLVEDLEPTLPLSGTECPIASGELQKYWPVRLDQIPEWSCLFTFVLGSSQC